MKMFNFARPKLTIKQEVLDSINHFAERLGLYDPKFDEESQCGGYSAFKTLCLLHDNLGSRIPSHHSEPGFYLMNKIHVKLREQAWAAAHVVRKRHKIHQYDYSTNKTEAT